MYVNSYQSTPSNISAEWKSYHSHITLLSTLIFDVLRSHKWNTISIFFVKLLSLKRQHKAHFILLKWPLLCHRLPTFHLSGSLNLYTWFSPYKYATFKKYTLMIIISFCVVLRRNKSLCFLLRISMNLAIVLACLTEPITNINEN